MTCFRIRIFIRGIASMRGERVGFKLYEAKVSCVLPVKGVIWTL